jgi:hypothetical protein
MEVCDKENQKTVNTSSHTAKPRKVFGGIVQSSAVQESFPVSDKENLENRHEHVEARNSSDCAFQLNDDYFYVVDPNHGELRIRKEHWDSLKIEIQQNFDSLLSDNEVLRDQLESIKSVSQSRINDLEASMEHMRSFFIPYIQQTLVDSPAGASSFLHYEIPSELRCCATSAYS